MTTKTTLRIPGRRDDVLSDIPVDRVLGEKIKVKPLETVRVAGARAGEQVILEDVPGDSVAELEFEDGLRLWLSVEQMQEDLAGHGIRGGVAGELVVPGIWPAASRSRGAGAWVVKGMRLLDVDLAGMGAQALAAYLEGQLEPGPGLFHCPDPNGLVDRVGGPSQIKSSDPLLVLVHGTASRTEGSFGGLAEKGREDVWRRISKAYGGRVYGFEHKTLTKSPIENARELASLLPNRSEIHLVSHSRGGLVGELLCQGARITDGDLFDDDDLRLFDDHGDHAEISRRELAALAEVLRSKQFRIGRFVRVACPARGTTLASRRLDRYLSIILNAIGLIPPLKASQTFDFVKTLLLAVAKERIDPTELPGLEAQMPTSPLVRMLNRPDKTVDADLSVIAGDLDGRGVWGRLKTFATDLFYREDHDLVVNTSAMYGGARRPDGRGRFFFDEGDQVNHFSYFRNKSSIGQLEKALMETGDDAGAFRPIALSAPVREVARRSFRGTDSEPRPVVFVLPGIMGTHLKVGDDRVWADPLGLALGGLRRLRINATDVEPDALMARAFLDLIEFLEQGGHEAIPFPYDWRLSILEESRRLGDAISAKLVETESSKVPVRIIAHSMGGIVARAMIAQQPSVWEALTARPGSRLLMLGTPNGGSYVIPRAVLGREKIVRQLALLDLRHHRRKVIEIVSRFKGLLELLPVDGNQDFFKLDIWKTLQSHDNGRWVRPKQDDLREAGRLREVLDASPIDPDRMMYVAGQAPSTPVSVEIEDGEVVFRGTPEGDGRVPWRSGPLASVPTWYMYGVKHGDLAAHRRSFRAIDDLLREGHTDRLPTRPPTVRGAGETFVLSESDPDQAVDVFPDRVELEAAAIGTEPAIVEKAEEPPIRVQVAHGDLAFALSPVAVGHYQGDPIVSAEKVLDHQLGGRLASRHQLDQYPGPTGTYEIVLDPDPDAKPGGAIVIGLGEIGRLTRGALSSSFANAALGYAIQSAEDPNRKDDGHLEIEMVSLLIGSSEAGISIDDSIEAMLNGVSLANRKLGEVKEYAGRVRISGLSIVELFEDTAVEALRTVRRLAKNSTRPIVVAQQLRLLDGGRRRIFVRPDTDWWLPLVIQADVRPGEETSAAEIAPLKFTVIGDRARSEVTSTDIDRRLVDGMIESAMKTQRSDPKAGQTLFELLVPNELKHFAAEQRDLVLVVDDQAARYPWELLIDRFGGTDALSLRSGMIRRLTTSQYRAQVITPTDRRALVIGDPPSDLPPLTGAQDEARAVEAMLSEGGFATVSEIRPTPTSQKTMTATILNALMTHDYRVVHLAGHGAYTREDSSRTGMIIGENRYLTPSVINQMRRVPELVFVNCCHLGYVDDAQEGLEEPRPFNKIAANFGAQLIRMGVRAVVAAGWPVDDLAAQMFAHEFYGAMLRGESFGDAVLQARQKTADEYGRDEEGRLRGSNTWGAYQCYGDQSYRMVKRTTSGGKPPDDSQFPFVAQSELIVELETIVSTAKASAGDDPERQRSLLSWVTFLDNHRGFPAGWRNDASVACAFGRAYAELVDFDRGIGHYRRALKLENGAVQLADVEKLGNMEVRQGEKKGSIQQVKQGIARLSNLLRLGTTSERLSLFGSGNKRLAKIQNGDARIKAIKIMTKAYKKAYELELETTGEVSTYPLLNYVAGRVLVPDEGDNMADVLSLLDSAERVATERLQRKPDFWNAIIPADVALVRHLTEGNLSDKAKRDEVVGKYLAGRQRASSPRQFNSVLDQVDFLIAVRSEPTLTKGSSERAKRARADSEALKDLRSALSATKDA